MVWQAAGVLLMIGIWILFAAYNRRGPDKPFPYPWDSVAALFRSGPGGTGAFLHAGASLLRWAGGFGLAVFLGIGLGLLMAVIPPVGSLLSPLITTLQVIPGLAWVPIVLILFGLGNGATVFMITVTAVVPVIINTRAGLLLIGPDLLRAGRMMELSRWKTFRSIILPGAAPSIVSGLRVGAANGFRVLISAEMVVGTGLGLGYSLFQYRWTLDYEAAFGSLLLIALIGLSFERLLFIPVEKRINRKRGLA